MIDSNRLLIDLRHVIYQGILSSEPPNAWPELTPSFVAARAYPVLFFIKIAEIYIIHYFLICILLLN